MIDIDHYIDEILFFIAITKMTDDERSIISFDIYTNTKLENG
jgi:hypothetical protein